MNNKPKYNPNIHHRHSIRLKGYDYMQAGLYFITICVQNRECFFGQIHQVESGQSAKMILNDAGQMIVKWYNELEHKFPDIRCHEMIVMPNHFHFIIENAGSVHNVHGATVGADLRVCPNDIETDEYPNNIKMVGHNNEIETDELHNAIETDELHNAIETDELRNAIETDELHNAIETDELHNAIETDELRNGIGTDELRNAIETDELRNGIGADELRNDIGTDENPNDIETDEYPNDIRMVGHNNDIETDEYPNNLLGEYSGELLGEHVGSPLHRVVQWFKTMTTNEYIRGVKTLGWQRFNGKLWQRNYYEHIIRNEQSCQRISEYILNNPAKWAEDRFYK